MKKVILGLAAGLMVSVVVWPRLDVGALAVAGGITQGAFLTALSGILMIMEH
jgi:hypothetical protein